MAWNSASVRTSLATAHQLLGAATRRRGWFIENLSAAKLVNLATCATQFVLKSEVMRAWPAVVKIDISPLCNLGCTACVHARPNGNATLERQAFSPSHKMTLDQYRRVVTEIAGRSVAVSLYYLGDPLMHPDLDAMCTITREAGLNSHVSTNFSFRLSDERLRRMVTSGLTHLTVCVDGLSQETYRRTRVGGQVNLVLSNLERLLKIRRQLGQEYPRVEVQYIKYQHNVVELERARSLFTSLGVDQVTDFWGMLHNTTDTDPGNYTVLQPKKQMALPQCVWPHFFMLIKYNGDAIPCCTYRQGAQYSDVGEQRVVGNVFETSVWDVWNSEHYRALRRLVSNPERAGAEPRLEKSFCHGCPAVYETDEATMRREAQDHRWEDLYQLDVRGRPVRASTERVRR